ncbi:DNA adenine methylase [Xanthobacter sp. KR7-225]|uniref:DNA adenine methylase n=1 Tax=Xanthobacter sp. KR7-225 TaxID=3156613 RepID=UPI0032B49F55
MTDHAFQPVRPTTPFAGYVGGKRRLAGRVIERLDQIPHDLYAEPFVGMGGVFLRRRQAPKVEVINDINRDVVTFFRVLQRHYVAFLEMLRFQLTSRAEFERLAVTDPSTLTDLERAARFAYLQRTAWGGKVVGRTFGVDSRTAGAFNITRLAPLLEELHERLAGVVIECLPWATFLGRYDRPGALFYLDPPYWGSEGYYGPVFDRADFERLAEALAQLRGRFLLSINDVPEVREIFARFAIEPVDTSYSLRGAGRKPLTAAELIVSGGWGAALGGPGAAAPARL